jgi:hypothetical protein
MVLNLRNALICSSVLAGLAGISACGNAPPKAPEPTLQVVCRLNANAPAKDASYAGSCELPCTVNALGVNFDGVVAQRACEQPTRTASLTLARTSTPGRWLGNMDGVKPEDPKRAEVVPNKTGGGSVARLPYGWFKVMELQETPGNLLLRLDASRQVRPDRDDLAIIDRAIALLPNKDVWNKQDNRECPAGQSKLSLFCAMMQATTEISGGVHYRQPAMQAVREELNLVDAARIKTHRIMDYNNHSDTTLEEVHALLRKAKDRVGREIR